MEFMQKFKTWLAPKLEWLRESWQEVRHKVTWPGKEEVWGTTRVVLISVLVFAFIVGVMDYAIYVFVDKVFALFA